jgi:hypothetical protein
VIFGFLGLSFAIRACPYRPSITIPDTFQLHAKLKSS